MSTVDAPVQRPSGRMPPVRPVAFYLPQFHPIPENDRAWGKGFTEWTNVTRARPLFTWQHQPHVPGELGFYDLRIPEVREQQAALAREHGIHGFCYYHFWFSGRQLLERPFDEVLASGRPTFPFCLCWANENWTRSWDGGTHDVLVPQRYSASDHRAHFRWLCRAFADPRYIRVEGKPIFLVYRASEIPDLPRVAAIWREVAHREGIGDVLLAKVESFPSEYFDPATVGFDLAIEFQPEWPRLGPGLRGSPSDRRRLALVRQLDRGVGKLGMASRRAWRTLRTALVAGVEDYEVAWVHDYEAVAEQMLAKPPATYPRLPCVTPMWDNTARRHRPLILKGSTPELYERWLADVAGRSRSQPTLDLLFINAWNEWAEGNHLEPCQHWGRAYLEATRRALKAEDRARELEAVS